MIALQQSYMQTVKFYLKSQYGRDINTLSAGTLLMEQIK